VGNEVTALNPSSQQLDRMLIRAEQVFI